MSKRSEQNLFGEFFVHFGILIFPLLIYQLWAYRRSFTTFPHATPIIGVYGGLCAIASEISPIHILGVAFDLKCIPIILSFLYGRRYAGIISLALALAYRVYVGHSGVALAILSILIYSIPPWLLANRLFDLPIVRKLAWAIGMSLFATLAQLVALFAYFLQQNPTDSLSSIQPYLTSVVTGALVQTLLIIPAIAVLEQMKAMGRTRLEILNYQASLKEGEQRYRAFIEHSPDGICLVDINGRFIFANHMYEQITGYNHTELIGETRFKLWQEQDRALADDIYRRVFNREVVSNVEVDFVKNDGNLVPVRFTAIPMIQDGSVAGYYSLVTDLRGIRESEEAVRKADKLATIGELAAGIAHEIRNPLTTLQGFLKMLKSDDPTTERYVTIMEHEIERLDFVSGQLLTLAKPQAETLVTTDVRPIVQQMVELLHAQAALNGIEMIVNMEDNRPMLVNVVRTQIQQAVLNVIKNAIEATPDGGRVTVSALTVDDFAVVRVDDTGSGIPPEMLSRLGEPFYTTKGNGNGLGLMITHRIVENHHGQIEFQSGENTGTQVEMRIPLSSASLATLVQIGGQRN